VRLFIFHYHLQTGGVTRVIRSHVAAARDGTEAAEIILLTGRTPPDGDLGADRVVVNPDWDYLDPGVAAAACRPLFARIHEGLLRHVGPDDILHVHNPNLGKNPVFTAALSALAGDGMRVVLHLHDFAEDRPGNMSFIRRLVDALGEDLDRVMYPAAPRVLFGVLNTADRRRLIDADIAAARIHWLPNPVAFPDDLPRDASACRAAICSRFALDPGLPIFLYPVRVIRRKNIGEFILFACLFGDRAHWLVTRPPENPRERPGYEEWRRFAETVGANVLFDVGMHADFPALMRAADRVVTTSRREGFGMVFLEPWLFGKPVVGRNLPHVTQDFLDTGLILNHLYDSLPVDEYATDFASLSASEQRRWIRQCLEDPAAGRRSKGIAAAAATLFAEVAESEIEHNRRQIEQKYSIRAYGQKLRRVYRALSEVR